MKEGMMWAKHWPNLDMELEEKVIGGVPLRLPKNRPRSLREAMRRVVERYPEKEAIVYEDLHLTYRETCKRIDQISASLIRLGFQKGDRLGLLFANTLEFVYCYFAICQIGAVSVALNYRLSSEELEYQLINTEAKGLMMDEEYWPTLSPIRGRLPALEKIFLVGNPEGKGVHSLFPMRGYIIRTPFLLNPWIPLARAIVSAVSLPAHYHSGCQ